MQHFTLMERHFFVRHQSQTARRVLLDVTGRLTAWLLTLFVNLLCCTSISCRRPRKRTSWRRSKYRKSSTTRSTPGTSCG